MKKHLIYGGNIGGRLTIGVVKAENEEDAKNKATKAFFKDHPNFKKEYVDVVPFNELVNGFKIELDI